MNLSSLVFSLIRLLNVLNIAYSPSLVLSHL